VVRGASKQRPGNRCTDSGASETYTRKSESLLPLISRPYGDAKDFAKDFEFCEITIWMALAETHVATARNPRFLSWGHFAGFAFLRASPVRPYCL
jgi:hypothetical protein